MSHTTQGLPALAGPLVKSNFQVTPPWYEFFLNLWTRADAAPVGTIVLFGVSTPEHDWLVCDGSAVSRSEYAALFEVIGTTWGSGDGSTTFNLPNLTPYETATWVIRAI